MIPIANPYSGGRCFFCGPENPIGLKLSFFETEDEPKELVCRWRAGENYRGLGSVLHGGIQCGLFDEIMGWTTHHLMGQSAVTGGLEVSFKRPVRIGQQIEVRCSIDRIEGRSVHLAAKLLDEQGRVCTEGAGVYVLVERQRFDEMMGPS